MMKVDVAHVSETEKRLTVVVPQETVADQFEQAYKELKKTVRLKGFRPGKAPQDLLEKYFKTQVEEDVIAKIVKESYPQAIDEVQVAPVSQPKIENAGIDREKEFSYTAVFEVRPKIEPQGYTGLALERGSVTPAGDEELAAALEGLRGTYATLKDVEGRPLARGDFGIYDLDATCEGKPYGGGPQKDFFLETADASYLPGFAARVEGMQPGEQREFSLELPDDFANKEFAGKKIEVKAALKSIKERVLPALDDEFARDLSPKYSSLDDLKKAMAEDIGSRKRNQAEHEFKEKLYDALIEKNSFEVPRSLVDMQARNMVMETRQMLAQQGIKLESLGQNAESLVERYRGPAERQVKAALILDAIAQKEGLEVSDGDIEKKYEEIAAQYGQDVAAVKAALDPAVLRPQILEKKAIDFITAKATLTEK
jgi:trigger factor